MKLFLQAVSFILLLKSVNMYGQNDPIQLDRPDQTECPFIVPKGYLQAENGLNVEKIDANYKTWLTPTILWKIGFSEKFETRLITSYSNSNFNNTTYKGLEPVKIGFKNNLFKEKGLIPQTAIIVHITLPKLATESLKTRYLVPDFRFTMQHTLNKKQSLSYNLGAEWDSETKKVTTLYTLTTGYSITEKLGAYFEIFGFGLFSNDQNHQIDGGFTYLINNNLIADISGGFGVSKKAPQHYVSLGFSYSFKMLGLK
jgi:Putative MetA-pathway of phenol degradation